MHQVIKENLYEKLLEDDNFCKTLSKCRTPEQVFNKVKSYGYDLDFEDFKSSMNELYTVLLKLKTAAKSEELGEPALESVAGGMITMGNSSFRFIANRKPEKRMRLYTFFRQVKVFGKIIFS